MDMIFFFFFFPFGVLSSVIIVEKKVTIESSRPMPTFLLLDQGYNSIKSCIIIERKPIGI